jgi:uncharacterized protein (DUF952 family)
MNSSRTNDNQWIYHITSEYEWMVSVEQGWYATPSLESEGFIHCSFREQVVDTATRYYAGEHGLVLLEIDPSKLTSLWAAEKSTNNALFPHVHGIINLDAVRHVAIFEPAADGRFIFPEEFDS